MSCLDESPKKTYITNKNIDKQNLLVDKARIYCHKAISTMKNIHLILTHAAIFLFAGFSLKQGDDLKTAESYFRACEFRKALPYYLDLSGPFENDKEILYKIGICYLHSDKKIASITYLEKALKLDSENEYTDIPFYLGCAYHVSGQFDKAILHFQLYKKSLNPLYPEEYEEIAEAERRIRISKNAITLTKDPLPYNISKLKPPVNTSYEEFAPVVGPDDITIFFASTRNECVGGLHPISKNYNEDIYSAFMDSSGKICVSNLGMTVNTPEHEAPMALSSDGTTLYFYRSSNSFSSDIYYSKKTSQGWSAGVPLGPSINAGDFKTGGCLSENGKRLYFSSDRPEGFGGMDLYYSDIQEDGEWGPAVNLGKQINTAFNEEAPFLQDNKLYFTSEGHTTIGGFDIFYSVKKGNLWGSTVNIGYPINTLDDDLYIAFNKKGNLAYFSRASDKNYGMDDIYVIDFLSVKKKDSIAEVVSTESIISLNDMNVNEGSEEISFKGTRSFHEEEQVKGVTMNVRVHFPFGIGNMITEYSRQKLDKLVYYLIENPSASLELHGYTDPVGSIEYNKQLSLERAETVKAYLLQKGIHEERLKVKACGAAGSKNVKSVRENVINRRVEIHVSL